MKIEIEGLPHGLPTGTYEVEPVNVEYAKTGEPVMKLRFKPQVQPPKRAHIIVEIDPGQVAAMTDELRKSFGSAIGMIYDHGPGCCCQQCPHDGNCRG